MSKKKGLKQSPQEPVSSIAGSAYAWAFSTAGIAASGVVAAFVLTKYELDRQFDPSLFMHGYAMASEVQGVRGVGRGFDEQHYDSRDGTVAVQLYRKRRESLEEPGDTNARGTDFRVVVVEKYLASRSSTATYSAPLPRSDVDYVRLLETITPGSIIVDRAQTDALRVRGLPCGVEAVPQAVAGGHGWFWAAFRSPAPA